MQQGGSRLFAFADVTGFARFFGFGRDHRIVFINLGLFQISQIIGGFGGATCGDESKRLDN